MKALIPGVFLLLGVSLLTGGLWLIHLAGSWYYAAAGLALIVTALYYNAHRQRAAAVYAGFLLVTLAWALWEEGADAWGIAPRIVLPGLLGLTFARQLKPGRVFLRSLACTAAAISLGVALYFTQPDSADPMFRAGEAAATAQLPRPQAASGDWEVVGHDSGGSRFSGLSQIRADNVAKLKLAWIYRTGEMTSPLEVTPIKVGSRLILCTGTNDVIALDEETGCNGGSIPKRSTRQPF